MDITLHKIGRRDRKIPISKLVGEPGKMGRTAWQKQCDVTKIRSATVRVGALGHFVSIAFIGSYLMLNRPLKSDV
jgi:hypothetical protein